MRTSAADLVRPRPGRLHSTRSAPAPRRPRIRHHDAAMPARGAALFPKNCSACHGAGGEGMIAPEPEQPGLPRKRERRVPGPDHRVGAPEHGHAGLAGRGRADRRATSRDLIAHIRSLPMAGEERWKARRSIAAASSMLGTGLGVSLTGDPRAERRGALAAFEVVDVDPLRSYPYRGWEDLYREQFTWDKVVRSTHSANCTGSCSWKVYVKDGVMLREEQAADYPRINAGPARLQPARLPEGRLLRRVRLRRAAAQVPADPRRRARRGQVAAGHLGRGARR